MTLFTVVSSSLIKDLLMLFLSVAERLLIAFLRQVTGFTRDSLVCRSVGLRFFTNAFWCTACFSRNSRPEGSATSASGACRWVWKAIWQTVTLWVQCHGHTVTRQRFLELFQSHIAGRVIP
ncbi:hypothetical protein [Enterobacter hormaechei]|uniref:hypothetical protein n=1 Tax=Enterobacter hormaechei TaxID=158836 RepID=UPI001868282C|nr:hypothetical protein [Enterobacter hormaechei]